MEYEITEEQLMEAAKRYGLKVSKDKKPGFFIGGKEMELDDLYLDLFQDFNFEEDIELPKSLEESIRAEKVNSKIKIKHVNNGFNHYVNEAV